jgi:ABC-type polar amino acid transport system ATPase subunit
MQKRSFCKVLTVRCGTQEPNILKAVPTANVVTLEMGFAREVVDRVLERATPQAFFNAPQHPRAQQFLSDIRSPVISA